MVCKYTREVQVDSDDYFNLYLRICAAWLSGIYNVVIFLLGTDLVIRMFLTFLIRLGTSDKKKYLLKLHYP